jgi:Mlc titration factor MtfA (ptsG expression regulator)
MFGYFRRRRRARLREQPFPKAWEGLLREQAPYYARVPEESMAELHAQIQVFLAEKSFEGCNGFTIDDSVRLIVAMHACLLTLRRTHDYYPGLHAILIYPDAFRVQREEPDDDGFVDEIDDVQEGESWEAGTVILSWKDVWQDIGRFDGRNVILHEFAHQLWDNGEAALPAKTDAGEWRGAMMREYEKHCRAVERNRRTYLDPYGAEDPAEFFSCTTEQFFEQPRLFSKRHPELYTRLRQFYHQDPVRYFDTGEDATP